jgi:hypothetical protein
MACTNQAGVFPHSNNNKLARADYLPPAKFFLGYLVPNSQLPIPPGWGCGSLVGVLAQHVQGSGNKKKISARPILGTTGHTLSPSLARTPPNSGFP